MKRIFEQQRILKVAGRYIGKKQISRYVLALSLIIVLVVLNSKLELMRFIGVFWTAILGIQLLFLVLSQRTRF